MQQDNESTLISEQLSYSITFNEENSEDIAIPRRFGTGSKPLFSRDDIHINVSKNTRITGDWNVNQKPRKEKSSSGSSSEENANQDFYISQRETSNVLSQKRLYGYSRHLSRRRMQTRSKSSSKQRSRTRSLRLKQSLEKIPYFSDAKREEDRLRAKIELSRYKRRKFQTPNRSRSKRRSRTRSRSADNRIRRRRRSRSRSRSSKRRYRSSRSRSRYRKRNRSQSRRRTTSRDRHRDRSRRSSPYQDQGQLYIPVPYPMEHSYPGRWIPPMQPYRPRNPFMFRPSLPAPFYPIRQPFVPMGMYPRQILRFPGHHTRPYRPGPK